MPISKRTGRKYAKGSTATLDGYKDVKLCATCGERLVITRQTIQFETSAAGKSGWHRECGRPA